MKKVLIIGSGGAGKSTASKILGEITGLPVVHLDHHYWKPNWVEPPKEEWNSKVKKLCDAPSWIMDGNHGGTIDYRFSVADTIIFYHLPRIICLLGVIKRIYFSQRADPIPGCKEKVSLSFLKWIWNYNKTCAPGIIEKLNKLENKKIYIIQNRYQQKKLFEELKMQR